MRAAVAPEPRAGAPGVRALLWGGPLVFLLHDAEEIASIEAWTRAHASALPPAARGHLPVTTAEFACAVGLLFLAYVVANAVDARRIGRGARPLWSAILAATLVANGLTHLVQAAVFGGYTPGVVTAGLLVLPFGGWLYRAGRAEGWLSPPRALRLLGGGILLQAALAPLFLLAGRAVAP